MTFCYAKARVLSFAKRCLAAQSYDILNFVTSGDHVVLAAEILQKMEANRVVVLVLRFFRLPERELVATGRAMATILRNPNP